VVQSDLATHVVAARVGFRRVSASQPAVEARPPRCSTAGFVGHSRQSQEPRSTPCAEHLSGLPSPIGGPFELAFLLVACLGTVE
jgi:hypothetical protein